MVEKAREALREEMKKLEKELRRELPQEIQRARALGDLRENAEYHAALERQSFVQARLGQLRRKLVDLATISQGSLPRDRAALGSILVVLDLDTDAEVRYELVISEESDVVNGKISVSSPIGKGLLGSQAGDERSITTPAGVKRLEVIKLVTVHDRDDQ
jgi:transcription elongation factor GreA